MNDPVPVCLRCWLPLGERPSAATHSLTVCCGADEPLLLLLCARCSALLPDAVARDRFLGRAAALAPFETSAPTGGGVRVVVWARPGRRAAEAA